MWIPLLALAAASSAQTFTDLYHFAIEGMRIESPLVQGADGNFYGTTTHGGPYNSGTAFKITPTGVKTTLAAFTNGAYPLGALAVGEDGDFYGVTHLGGDYSMGTVFKMTPAGVLTTLLHFTGNGVVNRGAAPVGLTRGNDGNFYGVTYSGGAHGGGTIFKMTPAGVLTTLVDFEQSAGYPLAALTLGSDGNFYGTTAGQDDFPDFGTVFKMTPDGVLTTLVNFTGTAPGAPGSYPTAPLVEGPDGWFYGTTWRGGSLAGHGTAFKVSPAGVFTSLAALTQGFVPSGFALGPDGNFYAVMAYGSTFNPGLIFSMTPDGEVTTLVNFDDHVLHPGASRLAELILASDGNFYGGTSAWMDNPASFGAVFKMTPDGALTTLTELLLAPTGQTPIGGLRRGANGNFFGLTLSGGAWHSGTAFEITPAGVLTLRKDFELSLGSPRGRLLLAADGDFYGVTSFSSFSAYGDPNFPGIGFRLSHDGVFTWVADFDSATVAQPAAGLMQTPDGRVYGTGTIVPFSYRGAVYLLLDHPEWVALLGPGAFGTFASGIKPVAEVVLGADDYLYGTTLEGGAFNRGTIFKTPRFDNTGQSAVTIVEFTGNGAMNKGGAPMGELWLAADGNFYGTTSTGGASDLGTIFKMTPAGLLTTLVEFTGNSAGNKGANPEGGLIVAADGNFYGVTRNGGADGLGTVFQMTPAGVLTTLHEFSGIDGAHPTGTLALDASGTVLYGITTAGGFNPSGLGGGGTIFRVSLAGPVVLQSITVTPASASVAAGLSQQFIATGHYTDGSTADLTDTATWESSDPAVATVNSAGVATGLSAGGATIRASQDGKSGSASLTVTAAVLQSITVTPASASIAAGLTQPFTATGHYSDGSAADLTATATWQSSDPAVASVDGAGLAQGLTIGSVTITATQDGQSGSATLTVSAPVLQSIAVTPGAASIAAGLTQQFTATGTFSDGSTADLTSTATWQSSDSAVATVNASGLATGVAAGTATITAMQDGVTGSATLTVVARVLQSITVTPATASVGVGEIQQFTATGTFSDGSTADLTSTATWQSSDSAVATVNASGLATGVAAGTATITAMQDGVTGSATLTVVARVLQSITVTPATASVGVGETQQFTATGTYNDGTTADLTTAVTWKSSNMKVATISASGLAKGVAGGTVMITASQGGIKGTAMLTVLAVNNPPLAVNDSASTKAGRSVTIKVLLNDSDPDGDKLTVTGIPTPPANGSVVINANNTITYTPRSGFKGTDSFQYQISDGRGGMAIATVTVNVK